MLIYNTCTSPNRDSKHQCIEPLLNTYPAVTIFCRSLRSQTHYDILNSPQIMVFLPTEILDAILDECDKLWSDWLGYYGRYRYAPLVTINRDWQAAVEKRTWKQVKLDPGRGPRNLEAFRSALRAEPRRRKVLKKVEIFFDDYFACPLAKKERERVYDDEDDYYEGEDGGSISGDYSDSEDATIVITHHRSNVDNWQEPSALISVFQAQNGRFFQDVKAIWDVLAEWPDDLQVTDITFFVSQHHVLYYIIIYRVYIPSSSCYIEINLVTLFCA